jgi:hypothetical protein
MYVLLIGTISNGMNVVGPFDDCETAVAYAEDHERSEHWEAAPINDSKIIENWLKE